MGMFFQGGGGYQPTGREVWHMEQRRQEQQWKAADREQDAANKIIWGIHDQVRTIDAQGHKQNEAVAAEVTKMGSGEVKRILSAGVTQYSGATHANSKGIVVWHWRATTPEAVPIGLRRKDAGPLMMLRHGGGVPRENHVWRAAARRDQTILDDTEVVTWAKRSRELITECEERYPILPKLRDDNWMTQFMSAAGMNRESTQQVPVSTAYGEMALPVRTVHVPELVAVEVQQDGLELVFAHREGESAKTWAARLDTMRSMFKAQGVHSERLRVTEDRDGSVRLRFDDAPSAFPKAIAPPVTQPVQSVAEAKQRYRDFRWNLGMDARGTVIAPSIREVFHVLAVGGTGSGKSVWVRGLIESARLSGFRIYLGDGKQTDYPALENAAGVAMRSSDAAQHVVLVAEVHDEMVRRQAVAEQRKRDGHADPFDFDPILIVLDEFASMRGDVLAFCDDKKPAMEPWLKQIAAISRKGRELKTHLVLASQDLYVENIPNQWQANFQLLVSLGEVEDKTLETKFIPDQMKEEAKRVGSRITRKDRGRGLFVDKANPAAIRIVEFQSFYSYSPGSTSLAPGAPADVAPPTPEVRSVWEQQLVAAEQMLRLYPRLGIKVESPEWRTDARGEKNASIQDLQSVATIALDDRDGNPIPELVKYDQRTAEWLGHEHVTVSARGSAVTWDDDDKPAGDPPKAVEEPAEPSTLGLTPEQIRAEAIRLGLIPADAPAGDADAEGVSEADTDVNTEVPDEPAVPTKTTKPKTNNTIGDF